MSVELRRELALSAGLVLLALFLFGMILPAPVFLDDWHYVVDARFRRVPWAEFLPALLSRHYFAFTGERSWQPLVTLLHYLCGEPGTLRVLGILLHAVNALLLRAVARRQGASEGAAGAAAALWLVFPFHAEAVFLSSFKGHLLAALSALAGLYAWQRGWLWASRGALVVGLLGKESALAGIALLALARPAHWRELAGHAAIGAAYLGWRFGVLVPAPALLFAAERRPLASFGWYLWSFAWPWPSCLARTLPSWPALLVLPFAGAAWALRRRPLALLGLLWFAAALLPYLHLIRFAHANPVADRYLYLASAGLCLALASLLADGRARLALVAVFVAWSGGLTARNGLFRDLPALCEQTAACAPGNPMAHRLLGEHRLTLQDFAGARASFERARALAPDDPDVLNSFGLAAAFGGDPASARESFERALRVRPTAGLHNNLGLVLAELGRVPEALDSFDRAIAMDANWPKPYANAAALLAKKDPVRAAIYESRARSLSDAARAR